MRRTWLIGVTALVLLLLPAALAPRAHGQGGTPPPDRNEIVTHGTGQVEVPPTQASVEVGVEVQRATAADAATAVARTAERIITRLAGLGMARSAVRTSGVQLAPVYTTPREGAPQLAGYRAVYTLSVVVTDLALAGRVLDEAVRAGATTILGVTFGLRDPSAARREALGAAVREAREKAEAIARAAGVQIRGVERIVEEGVEVPVRAMEHLAPGAPMPVEGGLLTVTARVTMVFRY